MVGENGDANRLIPLAYFIIDRLDETTVEVLDGLELQFKVAIMTSLITGLYVNIYEVVTFFECVDGSLCFALVVGVGKTSGTFHDDVFQSGIMTDATNQIDSRDD